MISPTMRIYIEKDYNEASKDSKSFVYMNRIQHKIDKELDGLEWICKNAPEIFLNEEVEMNDLTGKIVSHRRLKKLMTCLHYLNPNCNVALVLKKLEEEEEEQREYEKRLAEHNKEKVNNYNNI